MNRVTKPSTNSGATTMRCSPIRTDQAKIAQSEFERAQQLLVFVQIGSTIVAATLLIVTALASAAGSRGASAT